MTFLRNLSKKTIAVIIAVMVVLSSIVSAMVVVSANTIEAWDGTAAENFAGGTGTEADPYLIENGGQLYKMVKEYSNHNIETKPTTQTYFSITKDIDLNNKQWYVTGITNYMDNANYKLVGFCGIVYGNGHVIKNLYSNKSSATVGLIPVATQGAEIHDLHLDGGNLPKAAWNTYTVGAFIGLARGASNSKPIIIEGCSTKNFTIASRDASSAFVGYTYSQSITIRNCYAVNNTLSHTATSSCNSAAFLAYSGGNDYDNAIVIENSHCADIYPKPYLTTGWASKTTFTNVYTCNEAYDGSITGITKLTASQMTGSAAKENMPNLDWSVWETTENGYPVLKGAKAPEVIEYWDGTAAENFAGGTGTKDDPYLIANGGQLYKMVSEYTKFKAADVASVVPAYFKITKDIYLNNISPELLANDSYEDWKAAGLNAWYVAPKDQITGFSGIIDGAGHTIYGIYQDGSLGATTTAGLIPDVVGKAEITNLHIRDSICYGKCAGGIVGVVMHENSELTIDKCTVTNTVVRGWGSSTRVAGLVGGAYADSGKHNYVDISNSAVTNVKLMGGSGYHSGILGLCTDMASGDYSVKNCFTGENLHPVTYATSSSNVTKFAKNTKYENVYTASPKTSSSGTEITYEGVTHLSADKMKGDAAKTNMPNLDWTIWKVMANDYPSITGKVNVVTPPSQPENPGDDDDDDQPTTTGDYVAATQFAGGKGTPSDPYLISNASELYYLVSEVSKANNAAFTQNKFFKITNDIYLNDVQDGTPVQNIDNPKSWGNGLKAPDTSAKNFFYGTLDGDGHVIYGMYVYNYINPGLFGAIANSSTVKNLGFDNIYFEGGAGSAGAVAGYANWAGISGATAKISNCFVKNATMVAGSSNKLANAGGFIGNASNATIEFSNCYAYNLSLSASTCNASMIGKKTTESTVKVYSSYFIGAYPVTKTGNGHNNVKYYNVYTDQDIIDKTSTDADESLVKLTVDQMKGDAAKTNMTGFNFELDWETVANGHPILREGAGEWNFDHTKKGEVWSGLLSEYYASGSGSKDDPYIIETGGQLALLANDAINGKTTGLYYKITADIILNDTTKANWKETANEWYMGKWAQAFRGYLDGGYHTVSGLYLNKTKETYTGTLYYGGLFACIGKGAVIEKLGIVNSDMTFTHDTETKYLGAFAGFVDQYDGTSTPADQYPIIRECFADTTVYLNSESCGGFIGCATRPIRIENSFFTGHVLGTSRGLFGYSKMNMNYDVVLVKNTYVADSMYAVFSNNSYDNFIYENCYSSSAQDKDGIYRIFINRMLGDLALDYMTALDFENIWVTRGEDETPGLKGFAYNAYSNVMNPEDIVVNFESNCDLLIPATTGKAYSKIELPVPTRDGYTFEGWYAYPELDVFFDYDYFPTFNTILYAKWSLNGLQQDMEQYEDSIYDYHEGYEYYRPSSADYTADYVHNGAKAMHRLAGSEGELDFLLFYADELEVGKTYKMVFYVTTDEAKAMTDLSLVHHNWPDVYCDPVSVEKIATLDKLADGEWTEVTFTFTAKSKWIAIRTTGTNSIFLDDFTLYETNAAAKTATTVTAANAKAKVATAEVTLPTNTNNIVLVLGAVASVITMVGIAVVICLKKKHSHN